MIVRVSNFDVDVQDNHRPEAKSRGNVSFFFTIIRSILSIAVENRFLGSRRQARES